MSNFDAKAWLNGLPEETKKKLSACTSKDEVMKVLSTENDGLPDELLDGVSGGVSWFEEEPTKSGKPSPKCGAELNDLGFGYECPACHYVQIVLFGMI